MTKVFVYGTLKSGYGNNYLLRDSDLISDDMIKGYDMYSMGGFPGIVESDDEEAIVVGEVWEVDDKTLSRLNSLEGFREEDSADNFYNRKAVKTLGGNDCFVYVQDQIPSTKKVEMGVW